MHMDGVGQAVVKFSHATVWPCDCPSRVATLDGCFGPGAGVPFNCGLFNRFFTGRTLAFFYRKIIARLNDPQPRIRTSRMVVLHPEQPAVLVHAGLKISVSKIKRVSARRQALGIGQTGDLSR